MKTPRQVILEHYRKIKESGQPMAGPFYIVPMKSHQQVVMEPQLDYDDEKPHVELWDKIVRNFLKKEYKLSDDAVDELSNAPYGVPRGRVVKPEWHNVPGAKGKWVVYHGVGELPPGSKGKIMDYFNLRPNQVVFSTEDPHEHMQGLDRATVKAALKL